MKVILVADNDLTRRLGLMHHRPLDKDECAVFCFEREGQHSFWNKNVDFPISLIFCDKNKKVKDIQYLEAQQTNGVYPKSYDITYVIEAHRDAPNTIGISHGSQMNYDGKEVYFK